MVNVCLGGDCGEHVRVHVCLAFGGGECVWVVVVVVNVFVFAFVWVLVVVVVVNAFVFWW